jgi:hypothetical protein
MSKNVQPEGKQGGQANLSAAQHGSTYSGFSGDLLNGFEYSASHREVADSLEASRPTGVASLVSNIFTETQQQNTDTEQAVEPSPSSDSGGTVSHPESASASQRYVMSRN